MVPSPSRLHYSRELRQDFGAVDIVNAGKRRMNHEKEGAALPLRDALRTWGPSKVVAYIERLEATFDDRVLRAIDVCRLAGPDGPVQKPTDYKEEFEQHRTWLKEAWRLLMRGFEEKLETEQLFIDGVMLWPEGRTDRTPIPGVWATRMRFDVERSRVEVGGSTYAVVRVSDRAPPSAVDALAQGNPLAAIQLEQIPSFSDEVVVALIEEHARRVVENEGAKLLDAVRIKVSLMPIIRRKMEQRYASGETHKTLAAEARALSAWIGTKVPSHQVPTAKSIENAIGSAYQRPKA